VRTLLARDLPAGAYLARWDGRDDAGATLASGSYRIVFDALGQRRSAQVLMLR
jgi:flagellar hook assembly protein FlgD